MSYYYSENHSYIQNSRSGERYERRYQRINNNGNIVENFYETPSAEFMDSRSFNYDQNLLLDKNNEKRGLSKQALCNLKKRYCPINGDCSICMETYNKQYAIYLPCDHIYHENCITKWFETSRICPICREEIEE